MHPLHRSKNRIAKMVRTSILARAFGVAAATLGLSGSAYAIEFGPFSLTGFAKVDVTRVSSYCPLEDCQVEKFAGRHFIWSDAMVQGVGYGAATTHVCSSSRIWASSSTYRGGFKLSALFSQRWRDGEVDFEASCTRRTSPSATRTMAAWPSAPCRRAPGALPTTPSAPTSASETLGASGAGYGLLTRAVRYTSRPFDVAEGDLVVEATYDIGKSGWKRNKPRFWEL